MDLTRDPRFNTFALDQEEIKNQRSVNVQIQHYFNMIHHPSAVRLISFIHARNKATEGEKSKELILHHEKASVSIDHSGCS